MPKANQVYQNADGEFVTVLSVRRYSAQELSRKPMDWQLDRKVTFCIGGLRNGFVAQEMNSRQFLSEYVLM